MIGVAPEGLAVLLALTALLAAIPLVEHAADVVDPEGGDADELALLASVLLI